ncbi:15204_t:CDS:2, partial [Entrophospora sp. SA101]
ILQAMKEDPPLDFKCKDKFLVQKTKIRCVYLPPISTLDNPHQQPSSPDLPVNNVTNNNADPKDSDDSNTIAFDNRSVSNDNNTVKSHNDRD